MVTLSVTLQGADRLQAGLARAQRDLPRELREAMGDALSLVEQDAGRRLAGYGLRRVAGSLHQQVAGSGATVTGTLEARRPSAFWIERGRRPGKQPPIQAVRAWAQERGIPAFLVARAIGRRGIPPRPFLEPALEANRGRVAALFGKLGARVVARIAGAGSGGGA